MTGLELLKAPEATAGEIADIISAPCPPTIPAHCDGVSCRECWLTWLTGEPPEEKGPSDEQTAPCGGCPLQGKKRELNLPFPTFRNKSRFHLHRRAFPFRHRDHSSSFRDTLPAR